MRINQLEMKMFSEDQPEANVVECLIVNTVGLVSVLHQLVHRQGGVVRLHHSVGHLHSTRQYRSDLRHQSFNITEHSNDDLISHNNIQDGSTHTLGEGTTL